MNLDPRKNSDDLNSAFSLAGGSFTVTEVWLMGSQRFCQYQVSPLESAWRRAPSGRQLDRHCEPHIGEVLFRLARDMFRLECDWCYSLSNNTSASCR